LKNKITRKYELHTAGVAWIWTRDHQSSTPRTYAYATESLGKQVFNTGI